MARETQRLEVRRASLREQQERINAAHQAEEQLREAIAQLDAQLLALEQESTEDSYDPDAMQEETRRLQGVLTQARRGFRGPAGSGHDPDAAPFRLGSMSWTVCRGISIGYRRKWSSFGTI